MGLRSFADKPNQGKIYWCLRWIEAVRIVNDLPLTTPSEKNGLSATGLLGLCSFADKPCSKLVSWRYGKNTRCPQSLVTI